MKVCLCWLWVCLCWYVCDSLFVCECVCVCVCESVWVFVYPTPYLFVICVVFYVEVSMCMCVWMYLSTHKPKQSYPADSPSGPCLLPGISESRLDYISPSRDHLRDKTSEHQATNNVLVSSTRSKGQSTILHFFFFSVTSKINFTRKENITLHVQPTGIRTKHFPYTYKEVVQ